MASIRQEKVASLIKRDVGEIMQQNGTQYLPGKMITVTIVRMSPDLSFAKIYVSIFPTDDPKQDLEKLKSNGSEIRGLLGKRVKNQLRIVPELGFYLDDSLDYAERIDDLLND
ncbi:30S ribosome-binding factor RbfA [Salibacter halophilus]|uniref:Ribosome-binding factor A n=1 Tax=Salibacter halophilus TaxID=1803916 RepID=A0A6N6M5W2_9FLAO|nr:30S ribosome-binding factor RbfA [Salibacter halophilus]KAB1063213.1 30S ribosome-binding factor RbfA [Salibacter halophilus]